MDGCLRVAFAVERLESAQLKADALTAAFASDCIRQCLSWLPPDLPPRSHRPDQTLAGALPLLYGPLAPHPGALEQLFPTLELLCDDKVWSVRQACARVMGDLAELCTRAATAQPPTNVQPTSSSGSGVDAAVRQQQAERLERRVDEFQARLVRRCYLELLLPSKSQWVVTAARQQAGALVAALRPGLGGRGGGGGAGAGGAGGAGGGGAGEAGEGLLGALVEAYCAAASSVGQGAAEVRRAYAERFADVVAAVSVWLTRGSAGSGCTVGWIA